VPADDRLRLNEDQDASPPGPEPREGDPESPVERREPWPRMPLDVDGELLAQRELDESLFLSASE
jgi:hypothetical protein